LLKGKKLGKFLKSVVGLALIPMELRAEKRDLAGFVRFLVNLAKRVEEESPSNKKSRFYELLSSQNRYPYSRYRDYFLSLPERDRNFLLEMAVQMLSLEDTISSYLSEEDGAELNRRLLTALLEKLILLLVEGFPYVERLLKRLLR